MNLNKEIKRVFLFNSKKVELKIKLEGTTSRFNHYCKGRDLNSITIDIQQKNKRFNSWGSVDFAKAVADKNISNTIELELLKWFDKVVNDNWSGWSADKWNQLTFFLRTDCLPPRKKVDIENATNNYQMNNFVVGRLLNKLVRSGHATRHRIAETTHQSESAYFLHSKPVEMMEELKGKVDAHTSKYAGKKAPAPTSEAAELTEALILETIRELGL